ARGVDPVDGRSSLKLWLARAVMNRVRSTASYQDLAQRETDTSTEAVLSERFYPRDHPRWPGHWISEPASWNGLPADRLVAQATLARVRESINGLPQVQAQVITLRDVQAWTLEEVSVLLEISPEI